MAVNDQPLRDEELDVTREDELNKPLTDSDGTVGDADGTDGNGTDGDGTDGTDGDSIGTDGTDSDGTDA